MRHRILPILISGVFLAACSDDSSGTDTREQLFPDGPPLENVEAVFNSGALNCARTTDKKTFCWGWDFKGNLGDGGTNAAQGLAGEVLGLDSPLVHLDGSRLSTCGITESGAVYCWGEDKNGSLGPIEPPLKFIESDNPFLAGAYVDTPFQVFESGYVHAEFGSSHGCAIHDSGRIDCWGTYSFFLSELTGSRDAGEIVPDGWTPKLLAIGSHADCAISEAGEVWCWGNGRLGALGRVFESTDPNYESCDPESLFPITELTGFCTIAPQKTEDLGQPAIQLEGEGSDAGFCALLEDGDVKCWGVNYGDRFPSPTEPPPGHQTVPPWISSPISLGLPMAAVDLALGDNHVCVLLEDDSVVCAGENKYGQLGSERADGSKFTAVQLDGKPVDITGGSSSTCAALDTGRVQCWGLNDASELGVPRATTEGQVSDFRIAPVTVQRKE